MSQPSSKSSEPEAVTPIMNCKIRSKDGRWLWRFSVRRDLDDVFSLLRNQHLDRNKRAMLLSTLGDLFMEADRLAPVMSSRSMPEPARQDDARCDGQSKPNLENDVPHFC